MACRHCAGHTPVRLYAYPAGNPRAELLAAHRADEARATAPGPVHVHYDAIHDTFAVIRTDTTVNHP
ncbi:hypothetical protein ABT390_38050 [Streptomyces aurantiacus]|uniref:Uncharacterized protein n=1 Tax=Streptomyces aurantiacus JA 4570 TaxID=1286094 RepID=S3ZVL4_9ACTN|nr:hypothetical protein [Streptomyces aurantiacus]EPH46819.1 hypothetical protein STRAU_0091 [Streptomyces aurantiacus JA 4570]